MRTTRQRLALVVSLAGAGLVWSCAAGDVDGDPPAADGGLVAPTADAVAPSDANDGAPGTAEAGNPQGDDANSAAADDAADDTGPAAADSGDDATATDSGSDASPERDGGHGDAGEDAGHDSGPSRDGAPDASENKDAGHDAAPDAAAPDAGDDAGTDASAPDAGTDAAAPDAGPDAGCTAAAIVINEVQTEGTGGAEDEWVELFNPSSCAIDISGWVLKHESINGNSADTVWTAASGTVLAAGGYGVVAGTAYSGPTTFEIGSFNSGVLASDGGGLGLYGSSGTTLIDSMGYGSGASNDYVQGTAAAAPPTAESAARKPNGANTHDNGVDFATATTPTPGGIN